MKNENINYTISEITREKIFRLLNKELPYVVKIKTDLIYEKEIFWRLKAKDILLEDFILLSKLGKETFGLRKQDSLNKEQAVYLARCKSSHEDISLYF